MSTYYWQLYIDESGAIESDLHKPRPAFDECNVSGILVDQVRSEEVKDDLERQYRHLFPWAPWPFHQGEFQHPIYHFAWLGRYLSEQRAHLPAIDDATDNAVRALYKRADDEGGNAWLQLRTAADANTHADKKILAKGRRILTRLDDIAWEQFREDIEARLERLDQITASVFENDATPLAFICTESERGDAWHAAHRAYTQTHGPEREDLPGPWGLLFIGLIRRVIIRLLAQPGTHRLDVVCATRDIWHGKERRRQGISQKSIEHLVQLALADGAALRVERHDGEASITVRALAPVNFAKNAGPFLVHADRLANTARIISLYAKNLSHYQRALRARQPFLHVFYPIHQNTYIPGLSAIGVAENYLRQLRTPKASAEKPSIPKRSWAITQAEVTAHAINSLNILWGAS